MTTRGVADFLRERTFYAHWAAGILWVCYLGSLLLGSHFGTFNTLGEVTMADHLAWYTAARLVADGREHLIYDHDTIRAEQKHVVPDGRWDTLMAYRNPPFYCLLYRPTCELPILASSLIWTVVYIALLWPTVRWLTPEQPQAFLWLLTFYPFFAVISYGQNSLLSFVVLAGTYQLLAHDRRFLAGLVAGLLWFKPTMLLGLVVWGLLDVRKLWPAALGVVVMGGVLAGLSYLAVPAACEAFVVSLKSNAGFADFEQWKLHNPLGFWRLLLPAATAWHGPLAVACGLLAVGWFVVVWRRTRHDLPSIFGAVMVLTLWASPHAMIYEWVVLGITGMLWWPRLARSPDLRLIGYAAVWVVFFVSTHAAEGLLRLQGPHPAWDGHSTVQLSVPVVAVVAVVFARRLLDPAGSTFEDGSTQVPASS